PSLSPRTHDESPRRRTSAFLLPALPQPGRVIRLRADLSARKEPHLMLRLRGDRQIALADVHDALLLLRNGVRNRDLQAHQQIELLLGLSYQSLAVSMQFIRPVYHVFTARAVRCLL